jgi:predicted permease
LTPGDAVENNKQVAPAVHIALLVFPDFLLIAMGWFLRRKLHFSAEFFAGTERLVYYVLFPALLFQSIVRTPIQLETAATMIWAAAAMMLMGALLSWLAWPVLKPDGQAFASAVQCGFRFNSYIALALATRLAGEAGLTAMALLIGFSVPLANAMAVYALARHAKSNLFAELIRNPLLLSTVAGVLYNLAGFSLPGPLDALMSRLGSTAITLGILCVGAALALGGARDNLKLINWILVVRLLLLPLVALALGMLLPLTLVERQMLLLFGALPTASSAYVLAARMGGQGEIVALLISASTVLSVVTIPLWMQALL